jgi:predicted permease
MTSIGRDIRYACRLLVRHRGFTVTAALVLALGIGANTTIFTIVDAMLLRPLVGRTDSVVVGVYSRDRSQAGAYRAFSYPEYADLRGRTDLFASVTAHNMTLAGLTEGDSTRRVLADVVTANFFDTFGAPLAFGRTFTADEERPGANVPVTILSDGAWRRLGARPDILGQTIRLSGRSFTVVGVAAKGFGGSLAFVTPELWVPTGVYDSIADDLTREGATSMADRRQHTVIVLARLKPGATIASLAPALQGLSAEMAQAHPAESRDQELQLAPLARFSISTRPTTDNELTSVTVALMSMSAVVLLIASFNLANMLLARSGARRKEFAIRLAIGGSRARIVRQLVIEGFVLSLVGGVIGMLLATTAIRLLVSVIAPVSPVALSFDWSPDSRMALATLGWCVVATLIFGLLPAWKMARTDAVPELKDQSGELVQGRRRRLSMSNLLVTGQLAFSLVLLTTATIVLRGAMESASADPGFSFSRGVLVEMDAGLAGFDTERSRALYTRIVQQLRVRSDAEAVSLASLMPYGEFSEDVNVQKAGAPIPPGDARAASELIGATYTSVTSDYFRSIGLKMLAGREFTAAEEMAANGPQIAIIDEPLARRLFGAANPIGQPVQFAPREKGKPPVVLEVVGLAPGLRDELTDDQLKTHLYVPYGQQFHSNAYLHLRTTAPSAAAEAALLPELRRQLLSIDTSLPILTVHTLADWRTENPIFTLTRVFAGILAAFGGAALFLAAIGLYGLKAYVVSRRTREIGIRVALGASPSGVVWLVMREGLAWTIVGLAVGAALSFAAGLGMRALTYNGRGADALILTLSVAVLASAGLVATWLPARRAARIAPIRAIRS